MQPNRMKAAVLLGVALVSATLLGGAALVMERTWRTAASAAEASLQRSAQVVENAFNRQLLQVDSALAGLPGLFAGAGRLGRVTPEVAASLLHGFNIQSLSFRDMLLLQMDGTPWASARPRPRGRPLPVSRDELLSHRSLGATSVAGPVRNPLNGEWALYLARRVALPGAGEFLAVAEVPLAALVSGLAAAAGDSPNMRFVLEGPDRRLVASLPHDERAIGLVRQGGTAGLEPSGVVSEQPGLIEGRPVLAIARPTLYDDIRVIATLDKGAAFADWSRDRDRLLWVVTIAELLVLACAGALFWALGRQEELEAERQKARSQLENAIEAMSDGFVMWDQEDRLVTCNGKYRELYAESAEFIYPGARFEDIMRGGFAKGQYPQAGSDVEAWLAEMTAWHRETRGSLERLLPDGRWILVTERRTATGETVGIRTDITPLKAALDELAAANERAGRAMVEAHAAREVAEATSEAKSEFLASMSHEIRTPLNGVLGYTELLLDDPALTGDQRRHVQRIQTAGSALLTVVDDILDFSKIEAGQIELEPQGFSLAALVDNTVSITRAAAERKGLAFRVEIGPDLPAEVVGDHDRLRQVLLNLINNAIKFTRTGTVTLALAAEPGPSDEECRVRFRVTDTGIGIPKERMHRLFQRFSQVDGSVSREFGGTGLGLAISKRLVDLMGGEIGVESEHLHGTTFWFEVPLARPQAGPERAGAAEPASGATAPARILLVEDLEINRELARAVLEAAGHQVDTVGDGADAVMAVQARAYDVVLMDIQMPGLDGMTATRHIRASGLPSSRIPIVAMTANVLPQQVQAFMEAGMDDHVGKPFKRAELLAKVARWASSPGEAPADEGPAPGPGVLDRDVLDSMRELLGPTKLDEMLDRLVGELHQRFARADVPDDPGRLARDAHATISTAGMLGFTGLSILCREVEDACRAGEDVTPLVGRLAQSTRDVLDEIRSLRAA